MLSNDLSRSLWLILIGTLQIGGCASQVSVDQQIAREYERTERREAIKRFIASCESSGSVVIYTGPSYQKLRDPVRRVPGHARLSEYQCVSTAAVSRDIGVGG